MIDEVGSVIDDDVRRATEHLDNVVEIICARLIALDHGDTSTEVNVLFVQVEPDDSGEGEAVPPNPQ